jgi:KipI family sensor histidine kinase inhibitor
MGVNPVAVSASGDSAVRIVATSSDREANWRLIHHLAHHIENAGFPGVLVPIPTYDALLVEYDPTEVNAQALEQFLTYSAAEINSAEPLSYRSNTFVVPVLYGGEYGPDLESLAISQGLSVDDVIDLHCGRTYVVRCLGAPGGSPMMDGPDFPLPVPRLSSPRVSVPQGAVSVAGRQATITPAIAPGGWALLGRTPLAILDLSTETLVPYAPGDTLSFRQINEDEFHARLGEPMVAQ